MAHILAFLILIGGILGIVVSVLLWCFIYNKIEDYETTITVKYVKYRNFKENILPWIFLSVILFVFLFCLVHMYNIILGFIV